MLEQQWELPVRRGSGRLLWLGILFEAALGLFALGLGWLLGQRCWQQLDWSVSAIAQGAALSLPMLLLFWVCVRWPVGPLSRIKRFAEDVIRPMFLESRWLELALLSAAAGAGEELLFRGVLQAALSSWLGQWTGLGLASLLFGLMHPITLAYVILASLMGAYLGWAWITTGNLVVVIVAHALYDFVALMFLTRGGRAHESC